MSSSKAPLGPETTRLLMRQGLSADDIEAIKRGEVDWSVVELADGAPDLLLEHQEGGQRHVARLSAEQADQLLNAFEFERRQGKAERTETFPEASLDDWAGVGPDTNWQSVVRSYRDAVQHLGAQLGRDATAYLFLCRHTLELQLKTIIMLGQEARSQQSQLPKHHNLEKLWEDAKSMLDWAANGEFLGLGEARRTILDFHQQDPGSYSFRYPVTTKGVAIERSAAVQTFQGAEHATRMQAVFDALDGGITQVRLRQMAKIIAEADPPERK